MAGGISTWPAEGPNGTIVTSINGLIGDVILAAGTNISITPSGNTLTIASSGSSGWSITGNSGTDPAINFLGTLDAEDLVFKTNSTEWMRISEATGSVLINQSTNTGALNVKSFSDSAADGFNLQSEDGSRTANFIMRDNGDFFLYDLASNLGILVRTAGNVGTGIASPMFSWDVMKEDASTNMASPSIEAAMAVSNYDTTDGNYSSYYGFNSVAVDTAMFFVHDIHASGVESGHTEFWGMNAGTWAQKFVIAIDGTLSAPVYSTGIAHFDSSGVISSSPVDLASADITGNLPVANLDSGTGASSSTFWRGDGTWATPGGGGSGTVTTVSVVTANGFAGTVANATTTPAITLSTSITGILQGDGTAISAATVGNLTDVGTDGITIGSGSGAVLGSGTTISQHVADATHNGYLASADWVIFNGKQAAGSYITALTGDATASGPGSVALTLATVNSNVGNFTNANITVNAKGLITAASNGSGGNSGASLSAHFDNSGSAFTNSGTGSYSDMASAGTANTFTVDDNNGFTSPSAAASKVSGITFTPPRTGRIKIEARFNIANATSGGGVAIQLTDGTTVIDQFIYLTPASNQPTLAYLSGVYTLAATTATTWRVQSVVASGQAEISIGGGSTGGGGYSMKWNVFYVD